MNVFMKALLDSLIFQASSLESEVHKLQKELGVLQTSYSQLVSVHTFVRKSCEKLENDFGLTKKNRLEGDLNQRFMFYFNGCCDYSKLTMTSIAT